MPYHQCIYYGKYLTTDLYAVDGNVDDLAGLAVCEDDDVTAAAVHLAVDGAQVAGLPGDSHLAVGAVHAVHVQLGRVGALLHHVARLRELQLARLWQNKGTKYTNDCAKW